MNSRILRAAAGLTLGKAIVDELEHVLLVFGHEALETHDIGVVRAIDVRLAVEVLDEGAYFLDHLDFVRRCPPARQLCHRASGQVAVGVMVTTRM